MFADQTIAGPWDELVGRLDRAGAMYRWAAAEPTLTGIESVADLPAVVGVGEDRGRVDAVMGALVRTAAVAGGNVGDATLVLVHLLSPGLIVLARKITDLADCALDLVVGEACCQIRAFPVRTRRRSFAASILLDTRKKLLKELLAARPESPYDSMWHSFDSAADDDITDRGKLLTDLLGWATANNVISDSDAAMLHFLAYGADGIGATQEQAAAHLGCGVRTIRRHRSRSITTLKAHAEKFLQEIS